MKEIQVCLACNYENSATATHCSRCYAPLSVEETAPLSPEIVEAVYRHYGDQRAKLQPDTIAMYFVGKGQTRTVPIEGSLTLGRQTSNMRDAAFDLKDYHGRLLGVSRQHAVIRRSGARYSITDLDSTNGTWVNETQLTPNKPHKLSNGDQVRLGDLSLFVFLPELSPK
jgi:predicted component of type VI protein secretion system